MESVKQELILLRSLLLGDEFEWHVEDEAAQQAWEAALCDDAPAPLQPPDFSIHLVDGAEIGIQLSGAGSSEPEVTMHAAGLAREEQARFAEELSQQLQASKGEQFPLIAVLSGLQAYVAMNPPVRPEVGKRELEDDKRISSEETDIDLSLKVVLLWSHHLLATGKRKNIVQWSAELKLWAISKPGYPGVIVIEGLTAAVNEFVWRIKQLNWKALQVRCEIDYPAAAVPPASIQGRSGQEEWALRTQAKLAASLGSDEQAKIGAREVEGLNEVGVL